MAEVQTIVLKTNVDVGVPGPEHFSIESKPAPSCPADGILVQALVFSADPYQVSASVKQRTNTSKQNKILVSCTNSAYEH
jgi:predicted dinucleotide-binding enzyme